MKWNHNYWLGNEDSLLEFLKTEQKVQETSINELRELSLRAVASSFEEGEQEEGDFGEFSYMMSKADNLAVVNVSGSLVSKNRPYNRYMGLVSYDEIRNAVFTAIESDVDAIVLNMDTPGGQATGIAELSDFLAEVNTGVKPIYTYTGTIMASGGYWLGSVGQEIYASRLATVGSIGVVTVHASYKEMLQKEGIDVTVLRAGEFKALGSPYEKLDEKARAQIEAQMNSIYDVFLGTVAENRGTSVEALKSTAAEGRVFIGADAAKVGLVDKITSFDSAMAEISRKVKPSGSRTSFNSIPATNTGEFDMSGKRKVLTEAAVAAIASGADEQEVLNKDGMLEEVSEEEGKDVTVEAETSAGEPEADAKAEKVEAAAPATSEGTAPQSDHSALIDKLFAKVSDLTTEVATLTAKLALSEQACQAYQSTEKSLSKIAVQAINRMQVALGGVPMRLDTSDAATILEQYNRVYSAFNDKYKVGAQAEVATEQDIGTGQVEQASNSTVDSAVHRLTTSRVSRVK